MKLLNLNDCGIRLRLRLRLRQRKIKSFKILGNYYLKCHKGKITLREIFLLYWGPIYYGIQER